MPQVGSEEFSYDEKGKKAAAAESARTGKPVVSKKKAKKKEGPLERGRQAREAKMDREKSDREEFYAANPRSVLPSGGVSEGWNAGSKGHMSEVLEPMPRKKPRQGFKEGGVVYSDARGARAATRGTRYRS